MTEPRPVRERTPGRRSQDRRSGVDYLVFRLANEWYGAPVAHIREILKLLPLTPVPRAPHSVVGIISVRGQIITVVDLRRTLKLVEERANSKTRVLLADAANGETLGLVVDEVLQVHHLTETEIEHTSSALGNDVAEHIAGIARPAKAGAANKQMAADQMIILLDVKAVLDDAT